MKIAFRNNKLAGHGNNSGFHTPGKGHAIGFLDSADKAALRMDLWTKDMMVDEMADFFTRLL